VELREKSARGEPENLTYRRELSLAVDDLADALEDDGKLEQSLEAFRKSLAIARSLIARDPTRSATSHHEEVCHGKTFCSETFCSETLYAKTFNAKIFYFKVCDENIRIVRSA